MTIIMQNILLVTIGKNLQQGTVSFKTNNTYPLITASTQQPLSKEHFILKNKERDQTI